MPWFSGGTLEAGNDGLKKVCHDLAGCHSKVCAVDFDTSIPRGVNIYHGR